MQRLFTLNNMNDLLKTKIDMLPHSSGVYIYKNIEDKIIYVGKAKDLYKRVHQYFDREYFNKTALLVKEINDIEYIITMSEKEALVLEINLIKKHTPYYNIIFMDDKHYPYIAISKNQDPCLRLLRNSKNKKYIYFGPYPNSSSAYETIDLLNRIFPLRKCKNIPSKKCLYYDMGQCLGPCINKISQENYSMIIDKITSFLKGNDNSIIATLKDKMKEASDALNFEKALEYKNTINAIESIIEKQNIEFMDKKARDFIGFYVKDGFLSISILMYRYGYLNCSINEYFNVSDSITDDIISFLCQFYELHELPKEIYLSGVDNDLLSQTLQVKVITPKASKYLDLINMATINARNNLESKMVELVANDIDYLKELGSYINTSRVTSIDMCDMSHIHGDSAVGVVINYVNGKKKKNNYRKYIIHQENKMDDYASTYETIYRHYYNKLKNAEQISDILIVDGGKGQMDAALKAINELEINIKVIGLSKDNHHKTSQLIVNDEIIPLLQDSKLFMFLTSMQDEVHRFAITFFRNRKNKSLLSSTLDEIPGLGSKRIERLLSVYGTLDAIMNASISELSQIIPENVAIELKRRLNHENN